MGASVVRQDDSYSFEVITKTLDTVIPALIQVCASCVLCVLTHGMIDGQQAQSGLEVNFLVHLQSFAIKIFSTSKLFPNVWETCMILTRKRLLVDIVLTRRLSKALAFCEFASVNFDP